MRTYVLWHLAKNKVSTRIAHTDSEGVGQSMYGAVYV